MIDNQKHPTIYKIPFTLRVGFTTFHVEASCDSSAPGIGELISALTTILTEQRAMSEKLEHIMATMDELVAEVTAQTTKVDSMIALLNGIEQQLKDALAGVTLPADAQAKVDAVFAALKANDDKLQAAIDANTPPAAPTA